MEYSMDLDIDSSKNSIRRISDNEWKSLFISRYNTNFLLEGPEIIIPVSRENLIIQPGYLKKRTPEPKPKSSKSITQKPQPSQLSLEL